MGAVILGRYTRVRWCRVSPAILAQLEGDVNSLIPAALLEGAQETWGLAPGQPSLLTGYDIERSDGWNRDKIRLFPNRPEISSSIALPREGQWLLGVEHSASMWSTLRGVKAVDRSEICIDWNAVDLPGAGQLTLGLPRRRHEPFILVAPPPRGSMYPARLDRDGVLLTAPFRPEKGPDDEAPPTDADQLDHYLDGICHRVTPRYRYGLLENGSMCWLNIKPGSRQVTATPMTRHFRNRLGLLRRELAARGIYYKDDATETGSELRFAIQDGAAPGSSFYEPDAALAYTVSGEDAPSDDKLEQARALYDPENDWETGQFYAIDYPAMPARVDVRDTSLVFHTSEYTKIGGVAVNDAWAAAHLESAGLAAGLDAGASDHPSLTAADVAHLQGATEPQPIGWNAVDAADRVQRAIYVLATGGLPDAALEARLSRLRGPIVRALLARDALRLAADGDIGATREAVPIIPPLAPGPFPRRACAVIALADGLNDEQRRDDLVFRILSAMSDPLERQLARLFAGQISAVLDPTTITERPNALNEGAGVVVPCAIAGLTMQTVEAVLGSLEPPADAKSEGEVDSDAHFATAALRSALRNRSVDKFVLTWFEAPSEVHDDAGLWLLIEAVRTEALGIAAFLIENGVPIGGRTATANNALGQWGGNTPLGAAVEAGLLRAVHWCLEHGADPTTATWTRDRTLSGEQTEWPTPALTLAAKHGRADILRYLLDHGGDPVAPIANGITPLTAAAFGGSTECVELLLANGADANQPPGEKTVAGGPHTTTPLLYACDQGHDAVVRLLLERGADPRVPRSDGELALQLAMEACALTTLEALVSAGADAAAVNSEGLSVLHTAMLKRRADALPLLLSAGAPVDLPAGDRAILTDTGPAWTALMIAAAKGDGASVSSLLTAGADPRLVDGENRTALDLARSAADPDADVDPYDKVIAVLECAGRLTVLSV